MKDNLKDIWFTADLHLGHNSVLTFTKRGEVWNTIEGHDEFVIHRINERVGDRGVLYMVGDISFHPKWKSAELIDRIKTPNKFLIAGNHDDSKIEFYKSSGLFKEVHDARTIIKYDGQSIVLDHYPILEWPNCQHGHWMLHGHTHGDIDYFAAGLSGYKIMDVGWDASLSFHRDLHRRALSQQPGIMRLADDSAYYGPVSFSSIREQMEHRVNRPHHGTYR